MEEVTGGSENVFQLNKCFASFWNDVDTEKKQKGEYEILRKVEASWGSFCSYFFRKKKKKKALVHASAGRKGCCPMHLLLIFQCSYVSLIRYCFLDSVCLNVRSSLHTTETIMALNKDSSG